MPVGKLGWVLLPTRDLKAPLTAELYDENANESPEASLRQNTVIGVLGMLAPLLTDLIDGSAQFVI
jgi:hypothetical protein